MRCSQPFPLLHLSPILFFLLLLPTLTHTQCPQVLPLEAPHVTRVINGRPSKPHTSLYHVSLTSPPLGAPGARHLLRCTGTLLSPTWLLTAAHCNITTSWTLMPSTSLPPIRILSVHNHPNYTSDLTRRFDISLLHLTPHPPLSFYPSLNPLPNLPTPAAFLRVSGFGTTSTTSNSTSALNPLHEVDLPALPFDACISAYSSTPNLGKVDPSRQLCAGYLAGGCDACAGDSGGPLIQFSKKGRPVILAVVSAAAGCAKPGFPSINVRVQPFLDWISSLGVSFNTDTPIQVFISDEQLREKQTSVPLLPQVPLPPAEAPILTPPPLPVVSEQGDGAVPSASIRPSATPLGLPEVVQQSPVSTPSQQELPQQPQPQQQGQPSEEKQPQQQPQQPQQQPQVQPPEEKQPQQPAPVENPGLPDVQGPSSPLDGRQVNVVSNPVEAEVNGTRSIVVIVLVISIGLLGAAVAGVFIFAGCRRAQTKKAKIPVG